MIKEIEIIPLAKKKMFRRGVKEIWVKEAVLNADQVVEGYGGRLVSHKLLIIEGKQKLLRVVYEQNPLSLRVITAYLTSQIKRYWRDDL